MSRRQRFAVWVAAVAAVLGAPLWPVLGGPGRVMLTIGVGQSLAALTLTLWLLRTTPRDALRLSLQASAWTIVLGTMWMDASLSGVRWGVLLAGLGALICVCLGAWVDRGRAWATVLLLWHPLMFVDPADGPWSLAAGLSLVAGLGAVATAYLTAATPARSWHWAVWLVGAAAMIGSVVVK